jgi:hypothetical protein
MASIGFGGAVALVASSSVIAAGLTGVIQSHLEKSRRGADRNERRRDERKELYVRFRRTLDEYGGLSVAEEVPGDVLARVIHALVDTEIEMEMLAPDDVKAAAKMAFNRLSGWRHTAEAAWMGAQSDAERAAIVKAEEEQRWEVQEVIKEVTALMRAELLQE